MTKLSLIACVLGVAACTEPTSGIQPAPQMPTQTIPIATEEASPFEVFSRSCPKKAFEEPEVVLQAAPDDAPLTVHVDPKGVTLDTHGARAGRVLVELGRLAKKSLRVQGVGANVRIWAHVEAGSFDAVASAVARSASLVPYEEAGQPLAFLDPGGAARLRHAKAMRESELAPVETRVIHATHPIEAASVLTQTWLGCGGQLVAFEKRSEIIAVDIAGNLNNMDALLSQLEHGGEFDGDLGVPAQEAPTFPACDAIATVAAPNVKSGSTAGAAAGDLVLGFAAHKHVSVVVGCGGDRPTFFTAEGDPSLDAMAQSLGLGVLRVARVPASPDPHNKNNDGFDLPPSALVDANHPSGTPSDPLVLTSSAVAAEWGERVRARQSTKAQHIHGLVTADYKELAVALRATTPSFESLMVMPYAPQSLLIVIGPTEAITTAKAYAEGFHANDAGKPPEMRREPVP